MYHLASTRPGVQLLKDNLKYCFDLDGTLCTNTWGRYDKAEPFLDCIKQVNHLYDTGHIIKIYTARGMTSGKDWTVLTKKQLANWGIKHHELIMNRKPSADIVVDDIAINAEDWRKEFNKEYGTGLICGAFDIIHPGYIDMFSDVKSKCKKLLVALQDDPTIDRPEKDKPVQSYTDRKKILMAIQYIDEIIEYNTEAELYEILKSDVYDVRILGTDYKNKDYNGKDLNRPVYWHARKHRYSASSLKRKIAESLK